MYERAPYLNVLTHGFTVDAKGRKMSKSLGNVLALEKVIRELGADVLRLWVATTDYRNEITVSKEIFERSTEAYRRIRNTAKFFLSNLNDFNPDQDLLPFSDLLQLDQWAVDAGAQLQEEIITAYGHYQFHVVTQKIQHFCSIEMGSFYLDILKDRLYTTKAKSLARRSAQTAIFHLLNAMVRWIAPVLSFTAEEIWQYMPGKERESVFLSTWYSKLASTTQVIRQNWSRIIALREQVNLELERQRVAGKIGSPLAAEIILDCKEQDYQLLSKFGEELRFIFITSDAGIRLNDQKQEGEISLTPEVKIEVSPSSYEKCGRCWHRRKEVGQNQAYEDLCARCVANVEGEGELRKYV